ncbi:hypothetical protein AB0M47_04825 [Hamadaea sp. NPDC051192]|uniref:hypothetical protein n=1 Tax=Hamadaea sp. NPDC051192 TaxID=3154940 RepID=UPI00344A657A
MSAENTVRYWDPMPHLDAAISSLLPHGLRPSRDDFLKGVWGERNWRNVPGPFYGAMTDNCWVGRLHAPQHVLYGDDIEYEQEFLYRQPQTVEELRDVVVAMQQDPWAGWACDGDAQWSPSLVRGWWRERERLREWITVKHGQWSASTRADEREAAGGLRDYLAYVEGGLADYLRAYMYFLDSGASPAPGERVPEL